MPKLKRKTSDVEAGSGFEIYDGPEPKAGVYPAQVSKVSIRQSKNGSGNLYYNVLTHMRTKGIEGKSQYDGAPMWTMVTMADNDVNKRKEQNFYKAIGASADPDVVYKELDDADDPGLVTKIGGKNPVGILVRVQVIHETGDYAGAKGNEIFPSNGVTTDQEDEETDAAADAAEDEIEDADEIAYEDMGLAELRAECKARGIDTAGLKKAGLVAALEADDEAAEEADDDEEEEEEEEEAVDYSTLSLPALRAAAKAAGIDSKGLSKEDLIAALTGDDDEVEEDDSDPDEDEAEEPTYAEVARYPLPKLRKFCIDQEYEESDLKGMSKDQLLAMLIEDEILTDAPPF